MSGAGLHNAPPLLECDQVTLRRETFTLAADSRIPTEPRGTSSVHLPPALPTLQPPGAVPGNPKSSRTWTKSFSLAASSWIYTLLFGTNGNVLFFYVQNGKKSFFNGNIIYEETWVLKHVGKCTALILKKCFPPRLKKRVMTSNSVSTNSHDRRWPVQNHRPPQPKQVTTQKAVLTLWAKSPHPPWKDHRKCHCHSKKHWLPSVRTNSRTHWNMVNQKGFIIHLASSKVKAQVVGPPI